MTSKALWKTGRSSRDTFVTSGRRRDALKEAFAIEMCVAILNVYTIDQDVYDIGAHGCSGL